MDKKHCPLCTHTGGTLIYENDFIRVINADEKHYPAFTRVVLQKHIAEMSDLSMDERQRLMEYVNIVEQVQREVLKPHKINLAQFGTMVPHVHWHIIPRFDWDLHYPASFWSMPTREAKHPEYQSQLDTQTALVEHYHQLLKTRLTTL